MPTCRGRLFFAGTHERDKASWDLKELAGSEALRIAIDARMIRPGTMHGIARYVYHLLLGLRQVDSNHQYFVFVSPDSPLQQIDWPAYIQPIPVRAGWISFREQWELPRYLRTLGADLLHAPSFVAPLLCPCRLVMTIHDLNHMVLPQFYTPLHRLYYQLFVQSCIRNSEYILTVSNFSKREIVQNLGVPEDKVFVTYNGVSEHYTHVDDPELRAYVRDIYELPDRFILCVSNNKPHKNVHQLVRAYCYSTVEIPLVLACPVDRQLIQIAENYGKKHQIYFARFINEEHFPVVYSMTELFVYPSTYEGFGLPPLEALACGTPVVVARSSSLPEVVGQHAIFTNPFDYRDIARALEDGVENSELRQRLARAGEAHARRFSWAEMTRLTIGLYERCMRGALSTPSEVPVS